MAKESWRLSKHEAHIEDPKKGGLQDQRPNQSKQVSIYQSILNPNQCHSIKTINFTSIDCTNEIPNISNGKRNVAFQNVQNSLNYNEGDKTHVKDALSMATLQGTTQPWCLKQNIAKPCDNLMA